ncbi:MAG: formylglycine-generating enzyme family protein [Thermoguttaceae bacterium]
MKAFMRNMFVFSALLVFFVTSGGGARSQEVSSSERGASASNVTDPSSPGKAGDRMEIEIKGVKVAFRWCPPGSFTRHWNKSTEDYWAEKTTWDDDKKDFEITLTKGFWLAETETTQELWQAVMGENPSEGQRTSKKPVNNVSWDDTQEFISQLNSAGCAPSGYEFRLPTEAQWEYACMAGTTGERYGELDAIAWYFGNSYNHAHEVGQKKANAWGLYDMLGNVWEWCSDWYGGYPMKNLTDYTGPENGLLCVARGGSWNHDSAVLCSRSYRGGWNVGNYRLGFRLALVAKER